MRKPRAQAVSDAKPEKLDPGTAPMRTPQAFAPEKAEPEKGHAETPMDVDAIPEPAKPRPNWLLRLFWWALGLLVSLGLYLAAERLIADLYARYPALGWVGLGLAALVAVAGLFLIIREILALRRLANLDQLRLAAGEAATTNDRPGADRIIARLRDLYGHRADLARARTHLNDNLDMAYDAPDRLALAERSLMSPLDRRARALTAASARRVAIVTAISPRALVDLAFVAYESFRLARNIAALYGARPGLLGYFRLGRAVLAHLAITGGVALGDSVIQQLLGQGLAARLSARLGEGLVNGLMTVRIGIAAMRVTRPLPFTALKQPMVMDFAPDLAKIGAGQSGQ